MTNVANFDKLIDLFQNKSELPRLQWTMYYSKEFDFKYFKLYLSDSQRYAGKLYWKLPFLDVLFFEQNKTHVWPQNRRNLSTRRENIYPIRNRPLGKFWLPAPNKPEEYLASVGYANIHDECIRGTWNHRLEREQKQAKFSCDRLTNDYPFVHKYCNSTVCLEQLVQPGLDIAQLKTLLFHF